MMTNRPDQVFTLTVLLVDNGIDCSSLLVIREGPSDMDATPDAAMLEQALGRLNEHAAIAFETARVEAAAEGQSYVGCHHLLIGLAADPDCVAARVLQKLHASPKTLRESICFINGCGRSPAAGIAPAALPPSPRLQHIIVAAANDAERRGQQQIGTIHLLVALAKERAGVVAAVLERPGLGLEPLGREILVAIRGGWTD
jgi:ATP-dependent Clp protease ATP-binding subunit ClpC